MELYISKMIVVSRYLVVRTVYKYLDSAGCLRDRARKAYIHTALHKHARMQPKGSSRRKRRDEIRFHHIVTIEKVSQTCIFP